MEWLPGSFSGISETNPKGDKGVFRTQPNIKDEVFCEKRQRLKPLNIFAKSFILDVWQGRVLNTPLNY